MPDLLDPIKLGDIWLPNRVVMAPLTRIRAGKGRVPVPLMAEYYAQRAAAGLIIAEATAIDPLGASHPGTPGIWSEEQIEGWKWVTRSVHAAGGRIFLQLWHVGRVSDPDFLGGSLPVGPSPLAVQGHVSHLRPKRAYVVPRALETEEVASSVEGWRRAARHAMEAGFDGVELHGANGYLLDQFLQDGSNWRSDRYGGTIENRARLMLEAADAVISVWGPGRVGMHLSPRGDAHSMGDSNPAALFAYVAAELGRRKLAFICTREFRRHDSIAPIMKERFGGVFIANEGYTPETAQQALACAEADAVAFGKLFLANPDLPRRLQLGAPINRWKAESFYGNDLADQRIGYTDYPAMG